MSRGVARALTGLLLFVTVCGWTMFGWVAPASAAGPDVAFDATLDGRQVKTISSNDPLELSSDKPLEVQLQVTNNTDRTVDVAAARLRGKVIGLTFFNYDTQVGLKVAPGKTEKSTFRIGLADLSGQATGLLPTTVALLDDNSEEIVSKSIAVDVDGDLTSIYGVFGVAIAALTLLWLASLIVRLSRKTLPGNRWSRAIQFAVAGFGVGLSLTFSVSALSILTPNAAVWLPFVLVAGAIGFFVGYLTPGTDVDDPDEEDEFIASRQPALAGAGYAPPPAVGGSPAPQGIEQPAPWQGEIERAPLGLQDAAAPAPRPGPIAGPSAGPTGGPNAEDTVPRAAIYPTANPQPPSGPPSGPDDRDTIAGNRADFGSFFRPDSGEDEPPAPRS